jgi:hypothetical protein
VRDVEQSDAPGNACQQQHCRKTALPNTHTFHLSRELRPESFAHPGNGANACSCFPRGLSHGGTFQKRRTDIF